MFKKFKANKITEDNFFPKGRQCSMKGAEKYHISLRFYIIFKNIMIVIFTFFMDQKCFCLYSIERNSYIFRQASVQKWADGFGESIC